MISIVIVLAKYVTKQYGFIRFLQTINPKELNICALLIMLEVKLISIYYEFLEANTYTRAQYLLYSMSKY